MNSSIQKLKNFMMIFLLRAIKSQVCLLAVFYIGSACASGNLCDEIKRHINPIIEQSLLSDKVFGVERKFDEIKSITHIDNVIGERGRSYEEYLEVNRCIASSRNRFLDRNSDLFRLLAIGMLNDKIKNEDLDSLKKYVLKHLNSKDNMIVDKAISATIPLHDNLFIDALKSIVLINDSTVTKKDAIDAIGSIYSQESKKALNELKVEFKNTKIESYIDDAIYANY